MGKVFIPCRTVIEFEILTSLFLANHNYESIKELPYSHPSSTEIIECFNMGDNDAQRQIITYFNERALSRLKPVVMYARNHHDRMRMGNVKPNIQTRKCLFLALHRLKVKFLIIKNFIEIFRKNKEGLQFFFPDDYDDEISFLTALKTYYSRKNEQNLKAMLPTDNISDRVKNLLTSQSSITNERLLDMATYEFYQEEKNIVKFIMREIKSSIFVCKFMFARIDVKNPFNRGKDIDINEENFMISNDFLPELLPDIAKQYEDQNYLLLKDLLNAFDFMINKVLDGINYAYEISSGKSIILELNDLYYDAGETFKTT